MTQRKKWSFNQMPLNPVVLVRIQKCPEGKHGNLQSMAVGDMPRGSIWAERREHLQASSRRVFLSCTGNSSSRMSRFFILVWGVLVGWTAIISRRVLSCVLSLAPTSCPCADCCTPPPHCCCTDSCQPCAASSEKSQRRKHYQRNPISAQ